MRFGGRRISSNVGMQSGGGGGFGGFGGGGGGFPIGGGGMGCGGLLIVIVIALIFGINPLSLLGGGGQMASGPVERSTAEEACGMSETNRLACQVLASTEDQWTKIFQANGERYENPSMDFYERSGSSGCGAAQSAMGPFYCPTDRTIYLDPAFFDELQQRFNAPGDFAQAYVISHEVGHHVQMLTGIADKVRQAQSRASKAEANALQVKMELQADCYAGVWASTEKQSLDPGDLEEGLRAASAIGDDTLQKAAQGYAVPESFTHGTSAQRMQWLQRGFTSGDPAQCDTFAGSI